jgi:hypothetical protein
VFALLAVIAAGLLAYVGKPIYDARAVTARIEALNGSVINESVIPSLITGLAFAVGGREPLVEDEDITLLIPYLESLNIEYVGLESTKITDIGAIAIITACRSSLHEVDLSGTPVTERTIVAAADCPALVTLSVSAAALSTKGILAIRGSASLKSLYVYGPHFSSDIKDEVARALPGMHVEWRARRHILDDLQPP